MGHGEPRQGRVLSPVEILNRFRQEKERLIDPYSDATLKSIELTLEPLRGSLSRYLVDATKVNETLKLLDNAVVDGFLSSEERQRLMEDAVRVHLDYYRQHIDPERDPLEYFKTVYPSTPELFELLIEEFERDIDRQQANLREELARLESMKRRLHSSE